MGSLQHAGGASGGAGLSRREFVVSASLGALGSYGLDGCARGATASSDDINCIFILLVGGPSQLDTWDVKPQEVEEVRGPFHPIRTRVPGVWISELFPRLASVMDKVSIVRTLSHPVASIHDRGHQAIQTGREFDDGVEYPSYGSVLSWLKGPRQGVPPYHLLPGPLGMTGGNMPHGQGAGFLGRAFAPVDRPDRRVGSGREPGSAYDRYGATPFGRNCLRARQLIEAGARFVTINMFDSVFHGPSWDMHGSPPYSTFEMLRDVVGPHFDAGYAALIADLDERGLLDTTMVVAAGEFGRSPRVNWDGGRDHHALCWSGLLAGGKVRGGRVVGRSDKVGFQPADRPVTLPEFAATVYHGLNVPCQTLLSRAAAPPLRLAASGVEPVWELF